MKLLHYFHKSIASRPYTAQRGGSEAPHDTNIQELSMSFVKLSVSALAIAAVSATAAAARDQVQVAGSSTVLPYASIVAEAFGENFDFPTPVVESGGSSAGLKRFCEGVGENTIDVANASRKIKDKEIAACAEAGVTDIIEVRIGYDGIVFASQLNGPDYTSFTPSDLFNALAPKVLKDGALVDNPYTQWSEFNADLPAEDILAFISPSIGSSAASAVYQSAGSKAVNSGPLIWLAKTMPS